jgi:hypothetical protein
MKEVLEGSTFNEISLFSVSEQESEGLATQECCFGRREAATVSGVSIVMISP